MLATVPGNVTDVTDGPVVLYSRGLRQIQKLKREKKYCKRKQYGPGLSPLKFRITSIIFIYQFVPHSKHIPYRYKNQLVNVAY
jgi:hypothetical protein